MVSLEVVQIGTNKKTTQSIYQGQLKNSKRQNVNTVKNINIINDEWHECGWKFKAWNLVFMVFWWIQTVQYLPCNQTWQRTIRHLKMMLPLPAVTPEMTHESGLIVQVHGMVLRVMECQLLPFSLKDFPNFHPIRGWIASHSECLQKVFELRFLQLISKLCVQVTARGQGSPSNQENQEQPIRSPQIGSPLDAD